MDKFVVPTTADRRRRPIWDRFSIELDGKFTPNHKRQALRLLLNSYSQVCETKHEYISNTCSTMTRRSIFHQNGSWTIREGISGLEFDNKGIYLASVSASGCLSIHDFEALYCTIYGPKPNALAKNEAKDILHIDTSESLNTVRWNQANQDEVACASIKNNEVLLFDIGYVSSEPAEVLEKGPNFMRGLSDIKFASSDKSRLLASGCNGNIYIWDRRLSTFQCHELATNLHDRLNTVELDSEDRIVYGAGSCGIIHAWDLRGGKASFAFQSHKEVNYPLLMSLKLSSVLEKITSLKAQTDIVSTEIHSISFNPSCTNQLAFHLANGWSGVFDVSNLSVTHVHCPPPVWLDSAQATPSCVKRRPSWLPTCSIYAAGSSRNVLSLLDFSPSTSSACHVDFNEESHDTFEEAGGSVKNQHVPVSSNVLVCAAHPFNGAIIAGTQESSLLFVSQRCNAPEDTDCRS